MSISSLLDVNDSLLIAIDIQPSFVKKENTAENNSENKESILFKETDHEAYYYASALTLYKYQSLINGKKIGAGNYTKVRWHIINIFKLLCNESTDFPPPNSSKADKYARKICTAIICVALILIPFSIPLIAYNVF